MVSILYSSPPAHAQDDLATVRQEAKAAATKVADAQRNADEANGAYFAAESKLELPTADAAAQQTELADTQRRLPITRARRDVTDFARCVCFNATPSPARRMSTDG